MDDVYGMMVLNQSRDLVCNFDGLISSLNVYEWNNSSIKWVKNEFIDGEISILMNCHGYDRVLYPSVFPDELKGIFLIDQYGRERFIENPTDEEYDDRSDVICDYVPLGKLAQVISKHIKAGQIEISSVCNKTHRYVQVDRLVIRSDGSAYRSWSKVGHECINEFSEQFNGKE